MADNTPYTADESAKEIIDKLEVETKCLFKWFSDNQVKVNSDKCHLLITSEVNSK